MKEPKTAAELEDLIRRCVAGYPGEREMTIAIKSLPGQTPNWDCVVEYQSEAPIDGNDFLEREVAALKHRFELVN